MPRLKPLSFHFSQSPLFRVDSSQSEEFTGNVPSYRMRSPCEEDICCTPWFYRRNVSAELRVQIEYGIGRCTGAWYSCAGLRLSDPISSVPADRYGVKQPLKTV
jgi:hypothetical protein